MKAIICVGPPACGKTTFAEEYKRENPHTMIVCRDDIRRSLFNFGPWGQYKSTRAKEKQVTKEHRELIRCSAGLRYDVIIADTNLNPGRNKNLEEYLDGFGFDIEYKFFDVLYETLLKRDLMRDYPVGQQVIYRMWKQYQENFGVNGIYHPDTSLPKAVIFDVDGTLASMDHRGPFDWSNVKSDNVREEVRNILIGYRNLGYTIIIMSGRDGICRKDTEEWMEDNGIVYDHFFVRPEGNTEKDSIIKRRMFFENHLDTRYNIVTVVDDRPQMIREWYRMGIPNVICVGNPFLEF